MEKNPKQKAQEIFEKFTSLCDKGVRIGESNLSERLNALECCNVLINQVYEVLESGNLYMEQGSEDSITSNEYWIEVEKQLENIFQEMRINP